MPTTMTVTITRCGECPLYSAGGEGVPELCLHKDSRWDDSNPYGMRDNTAIPTEHSIPDNCPIIDTAVLYRVKVGE